MFEKKEKKITTRDHDEGVIESLVNAQKVSKDPVEQFLWLKNNKDLTDQQKIINMVNIVQMNFNLHQGNEIKLADGHIDYLMRAMLDALKHMQEDLPAGVYRYIRSNSEDVLEEIMKQKQKD